MKYNLLVSLFLFVLLTFNVFAAGSSDSGSSKTKTQYDMAVSLINAAKKFEQDDKLKKAKKNITEQEFWNSLQWQKDKAMKEANTRE